MSLQCQSLFRGESERCFCGNVCQFILSLLRTGTNFQSADQDFELFKVTKAEVKLMNYEFIYLFLYLVQFKCSFSKTLE